MLDKPRLETSKILLTLTELRLLTAVTVSLPSPRPSNLRRQSDGVQTGGRPASARHRQHGTRAKHRQGWQVSDAAAFRQW